MTVSTYLIVPPAIVALAIYMLLYYVRDPDNRVTDLRFLLACACFLVVCVQMLVITGELGPELITLLLCVAAWGLLGGAIVMMRLRPIRLFGP